MNLSDYKFIKIAGINMQSLAIDGIEIWRWAYKNLMPTSINADGTIYNNGLGYKDGYRIRSGGAEIANTNSTCTGFIKVNAGDVVRISGCVFSWDYGTSTAINVADSSFTNLGQLVGNSLGYGILGGSGAYSDYGKATVIQESDTVWRWIVPPAESGVTYIRITAATAQYGTPPSANLIVTVNEEII